MKDIGRQMCPVIGGIFTPIVYIVWLPLLIVNAMKPRRRAWLSFTLAAWAVLCPMLWLMASFSLLELNGVMSYDANFWGLIMFVVTAIALAKGGVSNRITDPLACKTCGYSLKGNQTGTCPECGGAVAPTQVALLN